MGFYDILWHVCLIVPLRKVDSYNAKFEKKTEFSFLFFPFSFFILIFILFCFVYVCVRIFSGFSFVKFCPFLAMVLR